MTIRERLARAICNASYGEDIADHPEYEEPHGRMEPEPTGRKLWEAFLPETAAPLAVIEVAKTERLTAMEETRREQFDVLKLPPLPNGAVYTYISWGYDKGRQIVSVGTDEPKFEAYGTSLHEISANLMARYGTPRTIEEEQP
jgi:hypothetical protein